MSNNNIDESNLSATPVDYDPFAGNNLTFTAPATESQQEIWASVQMGNEANCAYNESISLILKGQIEYRTLEKAFLTLINRHDALRTLFGPDGKTLCITEAPTSVTIPVIDLSHKEDSIVKQEQEKVLSKAVETPFDIELGPLYSIYLIKLSPDNHRLIFTAHHIICDGWSMTVLLTELAKLYSAFKNNISYSLPEPYPFSTYAYSQNAYLKSQEFADSTNYWFNQFSEVPPSIDLPIKAKRPVNRTFRSLRQDFIINSTLTSQLKLISSQNGCSLFVSLLSAFKVLLHRLSGQTDLTVGIPSAGQSAVGQNSLVGHCVNLLPIRSKLTSNSIFTDYMREIKKIMLDAYEHQIFTYGTLIKSLPLKRDPGRIPLVSVLFNVDQSISENILSFADLNVKFINNPRHYENFELFVNIMESSGSLNVECQYNTDLFSSEMIQNWSEHFIELLSGIANQPSLPAGSIPILNKRQNELQLITWNNTRSDYPETTGIHTLIERQCKETPDRIAVEFNDNTLSYRDLDLRSNKLAAYLKNLGAAPGTLIGVSLKRSQEMLIAMLGILKTGAAYVPLDPDFPGERISYMISDAGIKLLISEESVIKQLPEFDGVIVSIDKDARSIDKCSPSALHFTDFDSESIAYVIYTSGSTGKPKGVQVPHRAVVNFLSSMKHTPGITQEDTVLALTTLSFDIAVLELLLPLTVGARCVIVNRETAWDGNLLISAIEKSKPTIMQATPATWRLLLTSGWKGSPALKILCGGEAFPQDLASDLLNRSASVWNMYGPTETTVWSTCYQITDANKPLLIGRPIANTTVYILDESLQPVPVGVAGNLWIGGDGVTRGYLNRPELTERAFIRNPFSTDSNDIIYKTGDIARYYSDGNIECLGRSDNQVKIRGYRIELGEIESAISQLDTIKQCAVVICDVSKGDVRLVAFIVPRPQKNVSLQEVRNFLRNKLPEYMIPQHVSQTGQLPLTPNGKIDRKKLSSSFNLTETAPDEQYVAPSNDLEKLLVQIWQNILGRPKISIKENFFDLGGHSLLAVQIVSRILKETGVNLTLATFFTTPTIEELAASSHFSKLSESYTQVPLSPGEHNYSYVVPIKPEGKRTPFFCVHCVGGNVLNYNAFVPYLDKDQPLYGLQCKGLDGITEPFNDLQVMARNYVEEIRLIQPHGPYLLGGGSMGGLVAYEMAQQLLEMNQEVGLLVMLDTSCSRLVKGESHNSSKSLLFRIQNGIRCRIRDYRKVAICKSYLMRKIAIPHELRYWYIEQMNLAISDSYNPKPYSGLITMFRAALNKNCTDPYRGWKTIANGGIRFFDFECDHNNIVEHVEIAHKLNDILMTVQK